EANERIAALKANVASTTAELVTLHEQFQKQSAEAQARLDAAQATLVALRQTSEANAAASRKEHADLDETRRELAQSRQGGDEARRKLADAEKQSVELATKLQAASAELVSVREEYRKASADAEAQLAQLKSKADNQGPELIGLRQQGDGPKPPGAA